MDWQKRTNRFVLFFDILGFKDLVSRQGHSEILEKLESLNLSLKTYSGEGLENALGKFKVKKDQVHTVIFSDSIFVFSKSDLSNDAFAILGVAHAIFKEALENSLAIKGAISHGEITVDVEKSIFFGQPLIDAFLLHEDLQMLSVILDHNAENRIESFSEDELVVKRNLIKFEAYMKYGRIYHTLLRPSIPTLSECRTNLMNLYKGVSGKPRQYLDNTIRFFDSLIPKK